LRFTEVLSEQTRAEQFQFGSSGIVPNQLVRVRGGEAVVLRFDEDVAGETGHLTWDGVVDQDGLPVGPTSVNVSFPEPSRQTLFVEEATVLGEQRVRLHFSETLPSAVATDPSRYELRPRGQISGVEVGPEGRVVTLTVDGTVIGPTGQEASLRVKDMESTNGNTLAPEGNTVRLTQPADGLGDVYVYPNPYRVQEHKGGVTIAGLPTEATVRIFSPEGRLVEEQTVEDNRDGGADWDLRDGRGRHVPSGVYLIRVEAPDEDPVLKKAAVIR